VYESIVTKSFGHSNGDQNLVNIFQQSRFFQFILFSRLKLLNYDWGVDHLRPKILAVQMVSKIWLSLRNNQDLLSFFFVYFENLIKLLDSTI
jgi:hypothetical protein